LDSSDVFCWWFSLELWNSRLKIEFFSSSERPSPAFADCIANKVISFFAGALGLPGIAVPGFSFALLDSASFCGEDRALAGADELS
jgi:hypothetical protein